jgi:hypothetical protein
MNDSCSSVSEGIPKKIKKGKDKVRFECVLQTVDVKNRNGRIYPKKVLDESIESIRPRIKEGCFLGELDHPVDSNPTRQVTVRISEASHRFIELGWDGNKLIGVLETLRTPNGNTMKNLVEDGIPIGFSYRGMGEAKLVGENGNNSHMVQMIQSPLITITWDSVSYPSHAEAKFIRITEGVRNGIHDYVTKGKSSNKFLQESIDILESNIYETDDCVYTENGFVYIPNDFDRLVQSRIINIKKKYQI